MRREAEAEDEPQHGVDACKKAEENLPRFSIRISMEGGNDRYPLTILDDHARFSLCDRAAVKHEKRSNSHFP